MSYIWMSHVTRMNESCHTYEWVMSHVWMSYDSSYDSVVAHQHVYQSVVCCGSMIFDSWGPTAIGPPSFSQLNSICNKSCVTYWAPRAHQPCHILALKQIMSILNLFLLGLQLLGEAIANRKLSWFHKIKTKSIFVAHLIVQIFAVSRWSCRRGWSSAVVLHLCRLQWW